MEVVKVIVGNKVWQVSTKMAYAMMALGKKKHVDKHELAIVGVKKGKIYTLRDDVFKTELELETKVSKWLLGGYKVFTTKTNLEGK